MVSREYAREVVLKIADAVAGGRVVSVETGHVSGVSYLTIGDYGGRVFGIPGVYGRQGFSLHHV